MMLWSNQADRLDDETLLAAMAVGDQRAGAVFVRRHQRGVYGLAVTICRDPHLADDIAQQAFERAWRHAGSFDARRGTARVWLHTIARRLCIDTLRAQITTPVDITDLEQWMTSAPDPVAHLGGVRADVHAVRSAIGLLSPEQRRVLLLATIHGHTLSEIAADEGIPLGTAKTRLRGALLSLRATLVTEKEGG